MYVVLCLNVFGCQYRCNQLPWKDSSPNDLLCVEWDVKPYTLTHSLTLNQKCFCIQPTISSSPVRIWQAAVCESFVKTKTQRLYFHELACRHWYHIQTGVKCTAVWFQYCYCLHEWLSATCVCICWSCSLIDFDTTPTAHLRSRVKSRCWKNCKYWYRSNYHFWGVPCRALHC